MKNIILTGDRPTGKLHIGHYVGSLKQRVEMQNGGDYEKLYVMIADAQALTDNFDNPQKIRDNIIEVMLDYLAVGLDPNKTTFFVQSQVPALTELTFYYMNLVTLPRVLRNPTVKTEIGLRGFEGSGLPVGFATYPISQAADITAFKSNLIPVGDDQLPMIEQTREIVRTFNRTYKTDCLVECKSVLSQNQYATRLPGTDGAKMSKSLGNCIYLSDEPAVIKKKINSIVTFPRKIEEPGILENNVLFIYLEAFCQDIHFEKFYPEFNNLQELKQAYARGGIGDGKIKSFLYQVVCDILDPIRQRRKALETQIPYILEVLKQGSNQASIVANQTLNEVKKAMCINYFDDDTFLTEQMAKRK